MKKMIFSETAQSDFLQINPVKAKAPQKVLFISLQSRFISKGYFIWFVISKSVIAIIFVH